MENSDLSIAVVCQKEEPRGTMKGLTGAGWSPDHSGFSLGEEYFYFLGLGKKVIVLNISFKRKIFTSWFDHKVIIFSTLFSYLDIIIFRGNVCLGISDCFI